MFLIAVPSTRADNIFPASGNVGIGTVQPVVPLDIQGQVTNLQTRVFNTSAASTSNWSEFSLVVNSSAAGRAAGRIRARLTNTADANRQGLLSFGTQVNGNLTDVLTINNDSVGIGTTSPNVALQIHRSEYPYIQLTDSSTGQTIYDGLLMGIEATSMEAYIIQRENAGLRLRTSDADRLVIDSTGNVQVLNQTWASANSLSLGSTVPVVGMGRPASTGDLTLSRWNGSVPTEALRIKEYSGYVGIGTTTPQAELDVNGTARVCTLQITGGCDLAEPFAVAAPQDKAARIEPGMVVSIDPQRPGQLMLADAPYDRKVAGVISGANGLNPGMVMTAANHPATRPADTDNSKLKTEDSSSHPVALTGRVWCWCDADCGAITPGDRLTTSSTPGHAMKVTDCDQADGAVLGKAMSGLKSGKGLVLVLVSMQ